MFYIIKCIEYTNGNIAANKWVLIYHTPNYVHIENKIKELFGNEILNKTKFITHKYLRNSYVRIKSNYYIYNNSISSFLDKDMRKLVIDNIL